MSVVTSLKLHLPLMRRYARALTGSQERGDAQVERMLEMLLADPDIPTDDKDMRLAFYRMLGSIWSSFGDDPDTGKSDHAWEVVANHRLSTFAPAVRQAFTLVSVEGVNIADAAWILDTDEADIRTMLDTALAEIATQVSTEVLIIEDEPMIALELEQIVEGLGHTVIGIARTHGEALAIYSRGHPGLVMADIQLADGTSGIDAVNDMLGRTREAPPIVFVTAYPQRLLTGERPEPTFLVTKPFQPELVTAIISQALFFDGVPDAVA